MAKDAEYYRNYYQKNKTRILEQKRARRAQINSWQNRYAAENRKRVQEYKEASPCMDCGVSYPYYVMELHHCRGTKRGHVSQMLSRHAWPTIEVEIAKCDLVCANCHRMRHSPKDSQVVGDATSSSET